MYCRYWITAAVLGSLVACVPITRSGADASAVACTDQPPAPGVRLVYVDIGFSAGTPTVPPALCVVRSGTSVMWRTPVRDLTAFELTFAQPPGSGPSGSGSDTQFFSAPQGDRQQVTIIAKTVTVETTISYDITVDGSRIDPGIKIMPR